MSHLQECNFHQKLRRDVSRFEKVLFLYDPECPGKVVCVTTRDKKSKYDNSYPLEILDGVKSSLPFMASLAFLQYIRVHNRNGADMKQWRSDFQNRGIDGGASPSRENEKTARMPTNQGVVVFDIKEYLPKGMRKYCSDAAGAFYENNAPPSCTHASSCDVYPDQPCIGKKAFLLRTCSETEVALFDLAYRVHTKTVGLSGGNYGRHFKESFRKVSYSRTELCCLCVCDCVGQCLCV